MLVVHRNNWRGIITNFHSIYWAISKSLSRSIVSNSIPVGVFVLTWTWIFLLTTWSWYPISLSLLTCRLDAGGSVAAEFSSSMVVWHPLSLLSPAVWIKFYYQARCSVNNSSCFKSRMTALLMNQLYEKISRTYYIHFLIKIR